MASYENFQIEEEKYKNVIDVSMRPAKQGKKDTKTNKFWENFPEWITYYRDNPHRFCYEYLGLHLHWWQELVLYSMWDVESTLFLGSRGVGKTYLVMVYCICKCLLFPGTIIRVAAANKKQAGLLLGKINELKAQSPLLEREIKDIFVGKEESRIYFHGGGQVQTVVAGDGARGERAHIVIVDEREIVDKEVIDKVFIPFLTITRTPPYLVNLKNKKDKDPAFTKEYEEYLSIEKTHLIEMSSIGPTTSSMYTEFLLYIDFMSKGQRDYSVFSIPYQIPMSDGVIREKTIRKMIRESTTSVEAFRQEMEVIAPGENESSLLSYDVMNKVRKIKMPVYPITDDESIEVDGNKKKIKTYQPKEPDEIRILSVDLALMGTDLDDNTVFTLLRCRQEGESYKVDVSYMESMAGVNTDLQILRMKQLFYDLDCDYCVMDGGGIGQSFFDFITKKTDDYTRNKVYPAWKTILPDEKQDIRVLDKNAVPVLHLVKIAGANAQAVQAQMVLKMRRRFENKNINMLISEEDAMDILQKHYKFNNLKTSNESSDNEKAAKLIAPYVQITAMMKEAINTQAIQTNAGVKIEELSGRKDRIMCLLYGLSFVDILEQDLCVKEDKVDMSKFIISSQGRNHSGNRFGTRFAGFGR